MIWNMTSSSASLAAMHLDRVCFRRSFGSRTSSDALCRRFVATVGASTPRVSMNLLGAGELRRDGI